MKTHDLALERLAELGKTSGGLLHDIVNHVTAVTLSMNYFEQRAAHESDVLRQYALQAASMRKSIEHFAEGVRKFMTQGTTNCFFNPLVEIRATVDVFRYRAGATSADIVVTGQKKLCLYGNRLRFCQIISNLLSNALDAMNTNTRPRRICISCTEERDHVAISISDTGAGISPAMQKRLFTPFASTKQDRGTGLGLVSVKKIIEEDFQGRITLETTSDAGTTFSLHFRTHIGARTKGRARHATTSP